MSTDSALSAAFLDWWFAPWQLPHAPQAWPGGVAPGPLARRHGYRLWCAAADVPAGLPASCEPRWQCLAQCDEARLATAAALYGGLLAARERDSAALAGLPLAQRRWCMSVALTQPLSAHTPAAPTLTRRGLAELAGALATGFPGLWERVRLLLPAAASDGIVATPSGNGSANGRLVRCWRLCVERAGTSIDWPAEEAA